MAVGWFDRAGAGGSDRMVSVAADAELIALRATHAAYWTIGSRGRQRNVTPFREREQRELPGGARAKDERQFSEQSCQMIQSD